MLSIGDLARHTRVSVRMLRHYDAMGLVEPEWIDRSTGYRWYATSQIGRVNSLIALKGLGFTLHQCRAILGEEVSVDELRGMLRLRQAELEQQIETDTRRLAEVAKRLRSIEKGLTVTNQSLEIKPLPALRLAQVTAEVNDTSEIGTMTASLFDELAARLRGAGVALDNGIRTYYGRPDGSKIEVAVAVPLEAGVPAVDGLDIVDLAAEPRAAAVTHRGPAAEIADAWQTLDVALEERGLESHGVHRQVHLDPGDGSEDVVVELQCPVRDLGTGCS